MEQNTHNELNYFDGTKYTQWAKLSDGTKYNELNYLMEQNTHTS